MYKENNYPSVLLEEAVDAICSLPGVGRKGALRLALHLLKQPAENVHHLAASLVRLRDDVHYCSECSMISDGKVCSICSDRTRDHNTICVVETVRDVMSIENSFQKLDLLSCFLVVVCGFVSSSLASLVHYLRLKLVKNMNLVALNEIFFALEQNCCHFQVEIGFL